MLVMNNKVLIKNARAIVTCDSLEQVFYDCDILIDGPEIKEIGKNLEAKGAKVIDAKGKFVYEQGHLVGVDEYALAEKGEEVCTKILRSEFKEYF
jgi:formylmethanofuran dehydrogenase subunit A